MTIKDKSLSLLPNGFSDVLPGDAQREVDTITSLMGVFSKFGYQRIKPPLVEFEDSLLAPGPGARLASETFRLMDPVSHRMLGVRSDITPQISRIVSSRLENESRPLRLCYANDVLRTRGGQMRTERQFTQVGCEWIGACEDVYSDIEICMISVLGLRDLGITGTTIDFTIPGFVDAVLGDCGGADRDLILKAVSRRDADGLKAFDLPQTDMLVKVMEGSTIAGEALAVLDGLALGAEISEDIQRLRRVCDGVFAVFASLDIDDVTVTVDVLEQNGFEYHRSLGFTIFAESVYGELGRGGRYDICFGRDISQNDSEVAQGFTLYMDTVVQSVVGRVLPKYIHVDCDEDWRVVVDLQAQGWITVRGGRDRISPLCTHIYKNGNVVEIS